MLKAGISLDLIAAFMVVMVAGLSLSIYQVKVKKKYQLHKRFQLVLASTLLFLVVVFEVDVRLNGWTHLAKNSPYYDSILMPFLWFHATVATITTLLWIYVIVTALRNFPSPLQPNMFSPYHKKVAWLAVLFMYGTAVTGWTFYYMAFLATP